MHTAVKFALVVVAATLAIAARPANASTLLTVASYDMPNGNGTASGGGADYWDTAYSNCGVANCTTDGAALSGGKGLLTDGVIATESFGIGSGVGEYVGWLADPTIVFHFGATEGISELKLSVDNPSGVGGVGAPATVTINGTAYSDPSWLSASGPETIDITGLAINSSTITLALTRSYPPNFWVFASEAQFFGPSLAATPLPAAWSMMLIGTAGLGLATWRRRVVAAMASA